MHNRPPRVIAEPVVHSPILPPRSIKHRISQVIRLLILLSRNPPKTCLNAHHREIVAQSIKFAEESLVLEMVAQRVEVPILTPGDDPRSQAVNQVSRVGLDDDFRDVALVLEVAAEEHFGISSQGVDRCVELSALAGRTAVERFEGFVVVGVDVEEDTAGGDGIGATVVATGAVGSDDDCMAVGAEIKALVTRIAGLTGRQVDQVVEVRAVADVMVITSGSHEVLSRDVADVITLVVAFAPVVDRIVDASEGVLHRCCWRKVVVDGGRLAVVEQKLLIEKIERFNAMALVRHKERTTNTDCKRRERAMPGTYCYHFALIII